VSLNDHLCELAISRSGFVFDPHSGATFTLNRTGLEIVDALKQGATCAQISALLRETYADVPPGLDHDVKAFVRELRQQGLTNVDDPTPGPGPARGLS
jgi:hypothetical protein